MKVIKVSNEVYEKLIEISQGCELTIGDAATKLIEVGIKNVKMRTETVEKTVLIFEE